MFAENVDDNPLAFETELVKGIPQSTKLKMDDTFHLYVGSETGLFKAVNLTKKSWCNINKPSGEDRETVIKERQIEALCWSDSQEKQLCLGLTNQTVCVYDVTSRDFVRTLNCPSGVEQDVLVGLTKHEEDFLIATKSGSVKLWTNDEEPECKMDFRAGQDLERMRQNSVQPNLVATGGKQNDLKIWDLNNPKEPVFRAKNVRHDFLNLEVPIWVTDIAFLPEGRRVVTCTGHHQIRVYDPTKQRRPVVDIEWDDCPIRALSLRPNGYHVIVGNARGEMALVDLRGKAYVVQKYKGGAGSVRSIACHVTQPIVASCGLDRYVRIHDINSRKMLQKFYMKSKLNCLLFSSQTIDENAPKATSVRDEKKMDTAQNDSDDNCDNVWDTIETVKTKTLKRESEDDGSNKRKVENKVAKIVAKIVPASEDDSDESEGESIESDGDSQSD